MRPNESVTYTNQGVGNLGPFILTGGAYTLDGVATWGGGSATVQRLGPDGTNWLGIGSGMALTANGTTDAFPLPPGSYRIVVATATAAYLTLARVPGE